MSNGADRPPRSPELLAEAERYSWFPVAEHALPAESRDGSDDWVAGATFKRATSGVLPAGVVPQRCCTGRPWAARPRRWWQAVADYAREQADRERGSTCEAR